MTDSSPIDDAPLVLMAEDNEDNRIIAVTMLRHSGYRVIEATTGRTRSVSRERSIRY